MADKQPQAIDKVALPASLEGGHPFQNLKPVDVTTQQGQALFTSTTSTREVTISGRVVYRPIKR